MKYRISPKDWEAISAYLDGQLSQHELLRLENRLQTDKDLNAACNELRNIKKLLHNQPKIAAPRNFLLTPEMVGIKSGDRRSCLANGSDSSNDIICGGIFRGSCHTINASRTFYAGTGASNGSRLSTLCHNG